MRRALVAVVPARPSLVGERLGCAAPRPDVRLVAALKNQDAAAVRALLRQRADVNAPDVEGIDARCNGRRTGTTSTRCKALLAAGAKADTSPTATA